MLPSQHVFSHQHQYPPTDWAPNNHHQPHAHQTAQHHAHAHAVAAAAAAQQQHYGRLGAPGGGAAGAGNNGLSMANVGAGDHSLPGPGVEQSLSEDNRRVLEWIAQLLNASTRETALLELSKKREQVPELALILWHSFGRWPTRLSFTV